MCGIIIRYIDIYIYIYIYFFLYMSPQFLSRLLNSVLKMYGQLVSQGANRVGVELPMVFEVI